MRAMPQSTASRQIFVIVIGTKCLHAARLQYHDFLGARLVIIFIRNRERFPGCVDIQLLWQNLHHRQVFQQIRFPETLQVRIVTMPCSRSAPTPSDLIKTVQWLVVYRSSPPFPQPAMSTESLDSQSQSEHGSPAASPGQTSQVSNSRQASPPRDRKGGLSCAECRR